MSSPSNPVAGNVNTAKINRSFNLLREFYTLVDTHSPTVLDEAALEVFLTSNKVCSPPRAGSSEYIDEHNTRMALITEVQAALEALDCPGLALASLWVGLWTMPTSRLVQLLRDLRDPSTESVVTVQLYKINNAFPKLLHIFRGLGSRNEEDSEDRYRRRNTNESVSAADRDGKRCVVTGAPYPQVCHIFPFASLKHRFQTGDFLQDMALFWGQDRISTLTKKLCGRHAPGATNMNLVDTCANMISLSPQLHDWWGRGLFAFEPMGEARLSESPSNTGAAIQPTPIGSPSTRTTPTRAAKVAKNTKPPQEWSIQLRFHWLRDTNIPTLKSPVNLSADPIAMLETPDPNRHLAAVNLATWRPVENGQLFTITAQDPNALPDYDILLLQWDVLRMWRLAGGADPAIYSLDDDDDDYDDNDIAVLGGKTTQDNRTQTVDQGDIPRRQIQHSSETTAHSSQNPFDHPFDPRGGSVRRRIQHSSETTADSSQNPFDTRGGSVRRRIQHSSETTADSSQNPFDPRGGSARRRMQHSSETTADSSQDPFDHPFDPRGGSARRRMQHSSETTADSNQDPFDPRGDFDGDKPDATPRTNQGGLS
ncbi:uncharacterized protein LY79DRAFT_411433 [Colletotrichum navitas]|uniref:HNH nuclease domain-containing protein n=1 Tax=Colletotrichum navitas TaxID=681940 RepID=A0AAD8V0M5_9PEZI|nr:uncharacterized protein LY79DRAFT_411433 [Colletotrichum navitas]KAK1573435.1 hypothetical protein LY79DRAFT_411433 [Colletotrichum navitas]